MNALNMDSEYQTLWNTRNLSMNTTSECDEYINKDMTDLLQSITSYTLLIYPWLMIIIGTVSNGLSFLVFTRPKLKKSSTFFYLSFLCIVDLITLYTFCVNFIFFYQFNTDIQLLNPVTCRVYSFLVYFLPQLSAWTVAAVSFDRVISITLRINGSYASMARRFNSPKVAARVLAVIFLCLFLLNMQFFFYPNEYVFPEDELISDINVIYCSAENIPRYQAFYEIWVNIDLCVNVLIPFLIMIVSSIIIMVSLIKTTNNLTRVNNQAPQRASERRKESKKHSQVNFKLIKSDPNEISVFESTTEKMNIAKNCDKKRTVSTTSSSSKNKAKNVSAMLATNNLLFITLTLPIVVFLSTTPPISAVCNYQKARLLLIKVVCIILMNSNCFINIFIYFLMSSQFKAELRAMFNSIIGVRIQKESTVQGSSYI